MTINVLRYKTLWNAFRREYKRVQKYEKSRKITKDLRLKEEYKRALVKTYNTLITFLYETYLRENLLETKTECQTRAFKFKKDLERAFSFINLQYEFSKSAFCLIDIEKVTEKETEDKSDDDNNEENSVNIDGENNADGNIQDAIASTSTENNQNSELATVVEETDSDDSDNFLDGEEENNSSNSSRSASFTDAQIPIILNLNRTLSLEETDFVHELIRLDKQIAISKMAFDYLGNVSKIIRDSFDGDINKLDAFVAGIELASAASQNTDQPNLVKFIRTKLVGEAIDWVPANAANAAEVVTALRAKCKGDNTQVVLGRLLALRADRSSMQKFQETAEILSEKLRKSYISDGIPSDLANKMTIDKTVEMCRLSAKTQLVKSVLASKTFQKPKEVLSEFVTQSVTENTETKILSFRGTRQTGQTRGHFSNRNNNYRGNNYNYRQNYNNSNRNGNYNNYRNNNYNNTYRGNNRGRGRGQGNLRGRGQSRGYFNNNQRNVRYLENAQAPENEAAPSLERGMQQVSLRNA